MNHQQILSYCQDNFVLTGSRHILDTTDRDWDFMTLEMPEQLKPYFYVHIDKENKRKSRDITDCYRFDNTIRQVWRRSSGSYVDQIDIQVIHNEFDLFEKQVVGDYLRRHQKEYLFLRQHINEWNIWPELMFADFDQYEIDTQFKKLLNLAADRDESKRLSPKGFA